MRLAVEYLNEEAAVEILTYDVGSGTITKTISLGNSKGFIEPRRQELYCCFEMETDGVATPGIQRTWYHQVGIIDVEDCDAYELIEEMIADNAIGEFFVEVLEQYKDLAPK